MSLPTTSSRRVIVHIDLTGSRLGPDWLSADVELSPPDGWTSQHIRQEAARYYKVPLGQVDDPYPKTWEDDR